MGVTFANRFAYEEDGVVVLRKQSADSPFHWYYFFGEIITLYMHGVRDLETENTLSFRTTSLKSLAC